MTNHEAIQFLNNMIGEEHGRSIGADGFYRELCAYHVDALRIAIKALEQEPKTGYWILVSERVPEEYGEYLITWTTSLSKRSFIGISEGQVTNEYDHEHNRFKFEWLLEDYIKNYPDVEVIAWMPLPESYTAESEVANGDKGTNRSV